MKTSDDAYLAFSRWLVRSLVEGIAAFPEFAKRLLADSPDLFDPHVVPPRWILDALQAATRYEMALGVGPSDAEGEADEAGSWSLSQTAVEALVDADEGNGGSEWQQAADWLREDVREWIPKTATIDLHPERVNSHVDATIQFALGISGFEMRRKDWTELAEGHRRALENTRDGNGVPAFSESVELVCQWVEDCAKFRRHAIQYAQGSERGASPYKQTAGRHEEVIAEVNDCIRSRSGTVKRDFVTAILNQIEKPGGQFKSQKELVGLVNNESGLGENKLREVCKVLSNLGYRVNDQRMRQTKPS